MSFVNKDLKCDISSIIKLNWFYRNNYNDNNYIAQRKEATNRRLVLHL